MDDFHNFCEEMRRIHFDCWKRQSTVFVECKEELATANFEGIGSIGCDTIGTDGNKEELDRNETQVTENVGDKQDAKLTLEDGEGKHTEHPDYEDDSSDNDVSDDQSENGFKYFKYE